MKKLLFIAIVFSFGVLACGQVPPFEKVVQFNAGFKFGPNGQVYTSLPTMGNLDWVNITNKPLTFAPAAHRHNWSDLDNLPVLIDLQSAIETLGYLPVPQKSTTELASVILPAGKSGIVYDKTLKVYKLWDGQGWLKIVITNN